MKKLVFLVLIALLVRWGYKHVTNTQPSLSPVTQHYIVKTIARNAMPGQDIHVYDTSGTEVLSLVSGNPQYFYMLVGNYLVLDIGTDASQRIVAIYDIPSKAKIFESTYHPSEGNSLAVSNNIVQFYYPIWDANQGIDKKPVDAPSCTGQNNGYVETRTFDLATQQLHTSGIFTCTYFE